MLGAALTVGLGMSVTSCKDAVVDYHFTDLQPDDIADIRGNEDTRDYFVTICLRNIVTQMAAPAPVPDGSPSGETASSSASPASSQMYRRLLFAIETCYSGLCSAARRATSLSSETP